MFRTLCGIAISAVVLLTTMGCNVAPMFRGQRSPDGPVGAPARFDKATSARLATDISVVEPREVDLVETVIAHRAGYHHYLRELRDYYEAHGLIEKQRWAEFEQKGLRLVKPFKYLLDAEIASDELRPVDHIPEADDLYVRAGDLMRRGGYGISGLYNQDLMIEATGLLRELIEQYPNSDKIDEAAFLLGEIHKDFLPHQAGLAVKWYQRAWTWNPETIHPARYKAAVVYDYRLHDRARALELYHSVLEHEARDPKNVRAATRRIRELSSG